MNNDNTCNTSTAPGRPARSKRARRWLNIMILGMLALFIGLILLMKLAPKTPLTETQPQPALVTVMTVDPTSAADEFLLPGRVEPFESVTVSAVQPGKIVQLTADKGDNVTAGQPLLEQDLELFAIAEQRAALALEEAERELTRRGELRAAGAMAQHDLDALRTRRDLAAANLAEAKARLTRGRITSPIAGRIDRRYLDAGEFAREGDPLFLIIDTRRVKIVCHIPERDIPGIRAGQTMRFSADAAAGRDYTGTVTFIADMADPENNAFAVEITADNADASLKPGMITRVCVEKGQRENVIMVPLTAVVNRRGEHMVFVAEEGRARGQVVVLDAIMDDQALLTGGLRPGQQLVVEGHRTLVDGMPVTIAQ